MKHRGIIAWFTRNAVAANLLMVAIVSAGIYALRFKIPIEVFPDASPDIISIGVPYRGSTPAEAEEAVVIRVEEAIQDLPGIRKLTSNASEGGASVVVEVESGFDPRNLLDDIKNRVDAISTFPEETEKPVISLNQRTRGVTSVVVSGHLPERELRRLGEKVRDEILELPEVTLADLSGVRPYEIGIEVPENTLRRHGLTLDQVAAAIRSSSLDVPAGGLRTASGEILLRTKGQAYVGRDFEDIVVLTRSDGTRLTIGEIATVRDGFDENPVESRFNGVPCAFVEVRQVGNQNALEIARAVNEYIARAGPGLPEGVSVSAWRDRSRVIKSRLKTLTDSALTGGALVLLVLTLFLRPSLAIWVCMGIPVAFAGGLALMPLLGITINVISLFAFILVLGIVVDDAIVTGESIFTELRRGNTSGLDAAIIGTHRVSVPVTFGVLTTVVAFVPIFFLPGFMGKIYYSIPAIVIPVLLFSLVESKLILPAHLKHMRTGRFDRSELNPVLRVQRRFSDGLEWCVDRVYSPLLDAALRRRYLTFAVFVAIFLTIFGMLRGGHIAMVFFPRVESESCTASLVMPLGTPVATTRRHVEHILARTLELQDRHRDPETGKSVIESILASVGTAGGEGGRPSGGSGSSHIGEVVFEITPPEERSSEVTSTQLANEWRQMIGTIPGVKELAIRFEIFRSGEPIDIGLRGTDFDRLREASAMLKEHLRTYQGLHDIKDSFDDGKQEIELDILPQAEQLGLTRSDLARQVRAAFFGIEAQRVQRGRDDVRVMVRFPEEERVSLDNLERMKIRTPGGTEVPLESVANIRTGRSLPTIRRIDRQRTINVTSDVDFASADVEAVKRGVVAFCETRLAEAYPGIGFTLEGEAREQQETGTALKWGTLFVLLCIYAFLAIPFGSYLQPLIVMSVIPFGLVGGVLGHMVMGIPLSTLSTFGLLALAGVVVNDSLVLVDYVNQERRRRHADPLEVVARRSGAARFRAVILTSLTTFAGLVPLIFEKSTQAKFLIPMAVSLGFGVLFATFVTLFLVPVNYLILEDLRRAVGFGRQQRWSSGRGGGSPAEESSLAPESGR